MFSVVRGDVYSTAQIEDFTREHDRLFEQVRCAAASNGSAKGACMSETLREPGTLA